MRCFLGLLLFPFIFSGCQTSPLKDFENLRLGMNKSDVVEAMGSPQRTQRVRGGDHWIYIMADGSQKKVKMVRFEEGQVVYLGEIPKPQISAEEQDLQNEKQEQARIKKEEAKILQHKQAQKKQVQDDIDSESEIRYAPVFVPVR